MLSEKSEYAFASIIDGYVDFELFHYSHPDSNENQKYEQRLGKSIKRSNTFNLRQANQSNRVFFGRVARYVNR